jgi:hypothetical protein
MLSFLGSFQSCCNWGQIVNLPAAAFGLNLLRNAMLIHKAHTGSTRSVVIGVVPGVWWTSFLHALLGLCLVAHWGNDSSQDLQFEQTHTGMKNIGPKLKLPATPSEWKTCWVLIASSDWKPLPCIWKRAKDIPSHVMRKALQFSDCSRIRRSASRGCGCFLFWAKQITCKICQGAWKTQC